MEKIKVLYRVIAFVGKSGAGKDYLAKQLVKDHPNTTHFIVSALLWWSRQNPQYL